MKTPLRILIVEDEAVTALLIESLLKKMKYISAGIVDSGEDAIDIIRTSTPDLVLMDINLKGPLSGLDSAAMIKNIPVIFLTAHADKKTLHKAKKTRPYGFLVKPISQERLRSAIEITYTRFIYDKKIKENEQRYKEIIEYLPLAICRFLPGTGEITYANSNQYAESKNIPNQETGTSIFNRITPEEKEILLKGLESLDRDRPFLLYEIKQETFDGDRWYLRICNKISGNNGTKPEYQFVSQNITGRKIAEIELDRKNKELNKRIKALNCLYNVSLIIENSNSVVEEILKDIFKILPEAMMYPDKASVYIEYNGLEYMTPHFKKNDCFIKKNIIVNEKIHGSIMIGYIDEEGEAHPPDFIEEDRNLFRIIAQEVGRKIERITSNTELKKLETEIIAISEKERLSIGQELHDGLGQMLTGISFMLKTLENITEGNSRKIIETINEIKSTVKDASILCRQIAKEGLAGADNHDTLVESINKMASNIQEVFHVNCTFITEGKFEGNNIIFSQLFRIAQEAVNNAVRHALAKNIYISLISDETGIRLSIHDDGEGKKAGKKTTGIGLQIMGYRSDLIGGRLTAENHEDGGFMVTLEIIGQKS